MKNFIGTLLLVGCTLLLCGQKSANTIQLKEVETVAAKPMPYEIGKKQVKLDSISIAANIGRTLAELLNNESSLSLKTYGVSGSVSAASRGTAADHTALMWNGINLQSPTHGQFDFSLLPVFFIDNISIEPGAGSGNCGSGAVGGAIRINQATSNTKGWQGKVLLSAGSFGKQQLGFGLNYSTKKWTSSTKIYQSKANNDYQVRKFYDAAYNNYFLLSTPKKQDKANFLQEGLSQDNTCQINAAHKLSNSFLYLNTERFIINTQGRQWDQSLRNASNWHYQSNNYLLSATIGLQHELLHYQDDNSKLYSRSKNQSMWLQFNAQKHLNESSELYLSGNSQAIWARVDGYGNALKQQQRSSIWGGWIKKYLDNKLSIDLSARQQWIGNKSLPIIPSLGANFKLNNYLQIRAHSAKVYHAPDFNDLYWNPGGNPNLLAEQGWSHEAGTQLSIKQIKFGLTAFSNRTQNLIVWLPGTDYWSPRNVKEVWSRGLESEGSYAIQFGQHNFKISTNYSYTLAETTASEQTDDPTLGKQQLYIPKHKFSASLSYRYKHYSAYLNANGYGKNYIYTNNAAWLPAYQLINLRLGRTFNWKQSLAEVFANANNLADHFYMPMPGYPMPGRNFEFGINLKIK